jgi:predicted glycosyltransferase
LLQGRKVLSNFGEISLKIWLDALTPKQLLLFSYTAKKVEEELNVEILLTSRNTEEIERLNRIIPFRAKLIGSYGKNFEEKLILDSKRIIDLYEVVRRFEPDILVAYPNPTASRVAFGLKKKILIFSDTPHADHAHRLSVPLADWLVFSKFLDKNLFYRYILPKFTKIVTYRGVEELAWTKDYFPNDEPIKKIGLNPFEYVVFRPPERYASYYIWDRNNLTKKIIQEIAELDKKVVLFPRYEEDSLLFKSENVIIIDVPVFGLDLEYFSALTISGGGTMAREASLLGVPSFTFFPGKIHINTALAKEGFPIYRFFELEETLKFIEMILKEPEKYRVDTKKLIKDMEDPSVVVKKLFKNNI